MSDAKKRSDRTSTEIEALLREQAPGEIEAGDGHVSRAVTSRLRREGAGGQGRGRMRIGGMLDDGERVPRWFLAAAGIAIAVLVGWLVLTPGAAGPKPMAGPEVADGGTPTLPSPGMFPSAGRILAMAIEPQDERLRREARALVGAGWELAGRVLGGIPIELVKPMGEQRESG